MGLLLQVSAYPVILSLENHCNKEQQEVMAQYLVSILGGLLLTSPLDHATSGDFPSPNVRFKWHESLAMSICKWAEKSELVEVT